MSTIARLCKTCEVEKPLDDFDRSPQCRDGRRPVCKKCRRVEYNERYKTDPEFRQKAKARAAKYAALYPERARDYQHRSRYGMTWAERMEMFDRQGGVCAACHDGPAEHLHHNHRTGENIALLCGPCNQAEGLLKSSDRCLALAAFMAEQGD